MATKIKVNIGSDNGLLPDSNKQQATQGLISVSSGKQGIQNKQVIQNNIIVFGSQSRIIATCTSLL